MKVVQICSQNECDKKIEEVKVGNVTHNFCCLKGFQKSLKQFEEFEKNKLGLN